MRRDDENKINSRVLYLDLFVYGKRFPIVDSATQKKTKRKTRRYRRPAHERGAC